MMKNSKKIFDGKLLSAMGVALVLGVPAFAATDNGCGKDSNDRINLKSHCVRHTCIISVNGKTHRLNLINN